MSKAFSSLIPTRFPTAETARTPVSPGDESKQQVLKETPESNDRSAPDLANGSGSKHASEILVHNGSSGHASLASVQEAHVVQAAQKSELSAESETVYSGVQQTAQTVTRSVTTTTQAEVEEQKSTDVQKVEQSSTASEETVQARSDVSTFSSRTSASKGVEILRVMVPSKHTHSSVREEFLQLERLHREEKDRLVAIMTAEFEEHKLLCEEQSEIYESETERLLREISAFASRIKLLEDQLSSTVVYASHHDKVHSNTTAITTTMTSITTTMTTITTRIEQWKHTVTMTRGQITISVKELEQLSLDISNTFSRMTELQKHYAELSKDFGSVRHQLQVTLSLRDVKDHTIASLTAQVTQWKNADADKAKKITAARRDNEKLRRDFSAASSRTTELQKRYDVQSSELASVRKDLQSKVSLLEERDRKIASFTAEVAQWKQSDASKAKQIITARQDSEKLQKDLSASTSQKTELQKRYDAQTKEIESLRNELQSHKTLFEEKERSITTLTAEVKQWKRSDATKAEQFAAEHRDKEKLQQDLTSFSSRLTDLQKRYDAVSTDIVSVRSELQTKVSLLEEKEHTIASLKTEVTQTKREDKVKAEQISVARKDVEKLRIELSSASSRIADVQKRYEAQSKELHSHIARALEKKNKEMEALRRDLAMSTTRNTELQKSYETLSKDISVWKRADTMKAERIATTLEQVEKLQIDLSTSTSQLAEFQELQTSTSSSATKDRTIASLTAEVHHLKNVGTQNASKIASTLKQIEKLHRDASASASELAELRGHYEAQSRELTTVRDELHTKMSLYETKDHTIVSLTSEVDQWKRADATKAEQIVTTVKLVEKLQRDLSVSTSQLAELQGHYEAQSHELVSVRNELQTEEWKRTDALKEERIVTIRKQAEEFQRNLTTSSSQIVELQHRCDVQLRELTTVKEQVSTKESTVSTLTSQVEEWKHSTSTKEEALTTARKDIERLRHDLTTASSKIETWQRSDITKAEELSVVRKELERVRRDISAAPSQSEYQRRYEALSMELTSRTEQWKRSDVAKSEELTITRKKVEQLQVELSTSSSRITEFQKRYEAQTKELTSIREQFTSISVSGEKDSLVLEQIEQWKRSDATKTEELARARRDLEQLQLRLTTSSSQIVALEKHYTEQLEAIRTSSSMSEESRKVYEKITTEVKDYASVIKLTSTVDEWLRADAQRAEELALELEKRNKENGELRRHLITLKEIYVRAPALKQIFQSETVEVKQRHEEQSVAVKSTRTESESQVQVVQGFVATGDTFTDTMIAETLQKLNAEIHQTTTIMAESILKDFKPRAAKTDKGANLCGTKDFRVDRSSVGGLLGTERAQSRGSVSPNRTPSLPDGLPTLGHFLVDRREGLQ
ncbi:hypothetical protein J3R82DRAFT_7903 [Butyriboletus roseoflavus]|nr:hypothetical protein J3R82DRAFT_7903 [Butyriboletus roseoflavus]